MTADTPSPLVPKLRFLEFRRAGDWKRDQIGNIASITKGKGVSKADITKAGAIPCIRYAELYTHYREVIHEVVSRTNVPHEDLMLSQAEDIIIPASGETKVDIARAACVLTERVALGSDLNILRSDLYGPFFSYLLNSPLRHTIARMAQGDTVAHLYPQQLSQVWLAYPLRLEQQKIADCLGSLDDLITAEGRKLEALRQHKQGLMQQLFPQAGETVPHLRFPEFRNAPEWEEKRLGDLGTSISGLTYSPKDVRDSGLLVLRSSNIQNSEIALDDCVYVRRDINGANLTQPEDILICVRNGSRSLIGKNAIVPKGMPVCTHGAFMTVFRASAPHFARVLLQTTAYWKQVAADLGATINSINRSQLLKYRLTVPKPDEQQRIAECFTVFDDQIAAQTRKLEALRQHKQGLMQQLFPSLERNEQ